MVMLLFKTNHLFPNILKAGEYIHHLHSIGVRNLCAQLRCHNRFDQHRIVADCFPAQYIVSQQRPGLIA